MTPPVDERMPGAQRLAALYAPVQAELDEMEQGLQREFSSQDPFVDRLARHGFRLGGKRLRPALVLLCAQACGGIRPAHRVLAAALEMIHAASLLHDDVLDEATVRRHLATLNARWDNEASILLGDYLLARAIEMVGMLDSPFASRAIGIASRTVCEGELRQVQWRGHFDLSEQDYIRIIADKTAALTSCCCQLGAHYADADADTSARLARYGQYLGIAFQITDDLLDLLGDEATVGKSLGTDLAKQKPTLPLIRLLCSTTGQQREEILDILRRSDNHRLEALRPWLRDSDAISYAHDTAVRYSRQAAQELACLGPGPAREALIGLTEFVVQRQQ